MSKPRVRVTSEEWDYLREYRVGDYPTPLLTVDAVLFTFHENQLQVLLVERANHPAKGQWGLPGGFVALEQDADLAATVTRNLMAKTGVEPPHIEQLASYGGVQRDPRGWSVTVCYSALIAHQACALQIDSVSDVRWVPVEEALVSPLAFDHQQLLVDARERLRQKALYSIVPAYALPEIFTLPELQQLHEVLIGKTLQKKSFRRRIEQAELLIDTGEKRGEGGRPASLYRMRPKSADHFFVRNLES